VGAKSGLFNIICCTAPPSPSPPPFLQACWHKPLALPFALQPPRTTPFFVLPFPFCPATLGRPCGRHHFAGGSPANTIFQHQFFPPHSHDAPPHVLRGIFLVTIRTSLCAHYRLGASCSFVFAVTILLTGCPRHSPVALYALFVCWSFFNFPRVFLLGSSVFSLALCERSRVFGLLRQFPRRGARKTVQKRGHTPHKSDEEDYPVNERQREGREGGEGGGLLLLYGTLVLIGVPSQKGAREVRKMHEHYRESKHIDSTAAVTIPWQEMAKVQSIYIGAAAPRRYVGHFFCPAAGPDAERGEE